MRHPLFRAFVILIIFSVLAQVHPAYGQYREYYFYGQVLDLQKNPLPGVEITLRDVATSRSYSIKTNSKGEFRLAGLPFLRKTATPRKRTNGGLRLRKRPCKKSRFRLLFSSPRIKSGRRSG
jgi:hypothetical protein